jgi:hypothetical protein
MSGDGVCANAADRRSTSSRGSGIGLSILASTMGTSSRGPSIGWAPPMFLTGSGHLFDHEIERRPVGESFARRLRLAHDRRDSLHPLEVPEAQGFGEMRLFRNTRTKGIDLRIRWRHHV